MIGPATQVVLHDHAEGEDCNPRCVEVPRAPREGPPVRVYRMEHNHIFQVRVKHRRYEAPDCPACASVDLGKMDEDYAVLSYMQEQRERALRE